MKPLLRQELTRNIRYDEALRIGEDYDLLLRLVLDGARLCVLPQSFYRYRRHSSSISHRLSSNTARAMLQSHIKLAQAYSHAPARIQAALQERRALLGEQLDYEMLVEAIKKGRWAGAGLSLLRRPRLFARLFGSLWEKLTRLAMRWRTHSVEEGS